MNYEIDSMDRKILNLMSQNSRMPFLEIARELKVSGGTIHSRVKKLQDTGVLKGSKILIDPKAMGYRLSAFVGVQVNDARRNAKVAEDLKAIREVLEIHYTTGEFSLLIRVIVPTTDDLYDILAHKIQRIAGVQSTTTLIILNTILDRDLSLELC